MNHLDRYRGYGWNGCGLSWWRCSCGAARRVESIEVDYLPNNTSGPSLVGVNATPCKRCGTTEEPTCVGDPFGGAV